MILLLTSLPTSLNPLSKMSVLFETDHHIVEFDSKKTLKQFKSFCKELDVTHDYYLFEFDIDVPLEDGDFAIE